MKFFFMHQPSERSRRRWYNCYTIIPECGDYFTYDYNLPQAIFTAHDLQAIIIRTSDSPMSTPDEQDLVAEFREQFPGQPVICTMDIDVDLTRYGWVRKGDLPSATRQHFRTKQYRKAFAMAYRNVTFEEN